MRWMPCGRNWGYSPTLHAFRDALYFSAYFSRSYKRTNAMKADIHPQYKDVKVTCSCGNSFVTRSTLADEEMHLDVCSACHPFYTGQQKMMDTAGRVEKFRRKYG